eukprot:TRINITY_DN779_c0_g1_i8.p1 TRINITY_DN779_c0_g1~~TRINITY_DN779_c0_g1_i8.p1  ORF type:complete len:417 (-),score=126.56 TRINITY_DN779_c0_g1_i8:66-1316(-)
MRKVPKTDVPESVVHYVEKAKEKRTTSWSQTTLTKGSFIPTSFNGGGGSTNPFKAQNAADILSDLNLGPGDSTPLLPMTNKSSSDNNGLSVTGTAIPMTNYGTNDNHSNYWDDDEDYDDGMGFSGMTNRKGKGGEPELREHPVQLDIYYNKEKRTITLKSTDNIVQATDAAYQAFFDELHFEGAPIHVIMDASTRFGASSGFGTGSSSGFGGGAPKRTTMEEKLQSMEVVSDEEFDMMLIQIQEEQAKEDAAYEAWEKEQERLKEENGGEAPPQASQEDEEEILRAGFLIPEQGIAREQVRLREYSSFKHVPKRTFDNHLDTPLANLQLIEGAGMMLEVRLIEQEFVQFDNKLYFVNVEIFNHRNVSFNEPIGLFIEKTATLGQFKTLIGSRFNMNPNRTGDSARERRGVVANECH